LSADRHDSGRTKFHHLTKVEASACFSLASIVALRMFGLFMIFPILSLYIGKIEGATAQTVGIAIGIYGLTQGLLQIPYGMLSDRYGRRPLIIIGLVLFIIGSIVAAMSDSIWGIILGRVIQGSGAIAAVIMALTADLTREEVRTKAMAIIGATIGMAILSSFVVGPFLNEKIGIFGIFWVTAFLAGIGLLLIIFVVPKPERLSFHRDTETIPGQIKKVFANNQLNRINVGIFFLHSIFAACFVVFPIIFTKIFTFEAHYYGLVYLAALASSMLIMVPMIIVGERFRQMKKMFLLSIVLLIFVQWALSSSASNLLAPTEENRLQVTVIFSILLVVFFGAFNFLEAALPSLVAKLASPENKGTAMGVYSSFQYLGTFKGGILGGTVYTFYGLSGVFSYCLLSALVWFVFAVTMQSPRYLRNQLLNIGKIEESEVNKMVLKLTSVKGVAEAVVIANEGVAYLKVDSKALDEDALFAYSKSVD